MAKLHTWSPDRAASTVSVVSEVIHAATVKIIPGLSRHCWYLSTLTVPSSHLSHTIQIDSTASLTCYIRMLAGLVEYICYQGRYIRIISMFVNFRKPSTSMCGATRSMSCRDRDRAPMGRLCGWNTDPPSYRRNESFTGIRWKASILHDSLSVRGCEGFKADKLSCLVSSNSQGGCTDSESL